MAMVPFPVQGWEDMAAIVSILSLPLILVSVLAAFAQVKSQAELSRREATFNAFLGFSEKFRSTSMLRRAIKSRFERGDKTLGYQDAIVYYTQYWLLRLEEWEFLRVGLLPLDTYIGWTLNGYAHIAGEKDLGFFDKSGAPQTMSSRNIFVEHVLNGMFEHHIGCRAFFEGLYLMDSKDDDPPILSRETRYRRVADYVRRNSRTYRRKSQGSA